MNECSLGASMFPNGLPQFGQETKLTTDMRRLNMHYVIAIIHNSVTTVFGCPENVPTGANLTIEVNIYVQIRT